LLSLITAGEHSEGDGLAEELVKMLTALRRNVRANALKHA
jgi:hypothetical protein